ncbi:hypothetical protein FZZ93_12795 [Halomonas eurihalina]|uniref:Penicillin-binding protein activator LpoB n=1 Tax=Halomonas eurihalina TaxID=42566 RepID=A0A5D9CVS0_HALER|nr:hypothetical protein [Halomonas eurihalina]MDR5861017.1 hypothetical protein [Halomonas eurihalina]TZG35659.1 hypothetical protein FZZ93_12795 [Halomonas eurihalina]
MNVRTLALLVLLFVIAGCAAAPERPKTVRQALFGLSERAAEQVAASPNLPTPATDQVLLLAMPEIDPDLGLSDERLMESLTRALLGLDDGPQVLDWRPALADAGRNQWRLDSRLNASAPRLQLSDRVLLPYRLTLTLRRPGSEQALWQAHIDGALDATAL